MGRRVWALIVMLAVAPLASRAQEPLAVARAQFRNGLAHAQAGDWPAALAAFTAAHALAPFPAVLFNLAGAQLRCGKLLAANTNYRRLLASPADGLTKAQRSAAQRQVAWIEEHIPRLRVRIEGLNTSDRVLLDQARLYPDELDRDMWLDPGPHQLTIYRTRAHPELRSFVLAEGEHRVLLLSLPDG